MTQQPPHTPGFTAGQTADDMWEKGRKLYTQEARFHAIIQSVVNQALLAHGRIDPERADLGAYEVALKACSVLLVRIYEDDAELTFWKGQADRLLEMAQEAMLVSPKPMFFALNSDGGSAA